MFVKVNLDAAIFKDQRYLGVSVVVRDSVENFLAGFFK